MNKYLLTPNREPMTGQSSYHQCPIGQTSVFIGATGLWVKSRNDSEAAASPKAHPSPRILEAAPQVGRCLFQTAQLV